MSATGTKYYVEWGGKSRVVEVRQGKDGLEVLLDGISHPADVTAVESGALLNLLFDGESVTYAARFENGSAVLSFHDREVTVPIEDERGRMARMATGSTRAASTKSEVHSVMPGVVKEVLVQAGDAVQTGQPLLILEAMKMENEVRSTRDGSVGTVHVEAGQAVEKSALLVSLAPAE